MNQYVDPYRDAYRSALEDPEGFWGERAAALHWEERLGSGTRLEPGAALPVLQGRAHQHLLRRARPRNDRRALVPGPARGES
jgi:hypothetical protein